MYDLNVGIVAIYNGLIWVGKRSRQGTWQMPQGGIDEGETSFQAASRELKEETGITDVEWLGETGWHLYNFPDQVRKNAFFANKKGKRQKWFYAHVYSIEDMSLNEEFVDFKWENDEWIKMNIVGFKRSTYNYVFSNPIYEKIKSKNILQ
ncbi:NUDIX domain-containing protein [Candidatus Cytomitobacter indipagum]|uniref:NUDIX domain-containing protein n=1 Tax=Candidatus Cytomitobacter indipagum TaxID=2601575 RepID=A0A5C0UEC2_9PROT|nr:NUDIX domain-containing protein [Candidatus Cytomitobacter indipagum]QEK38109.1 NUDIX domain-containing protein [Candidatus Cytomitobacter indipagum]